MVRITDRPDMTVDVKNNSINQNLEMAETIRIHVEEQIMRAS